MGFGITFAPLVPAYVLWAALAVAIVLVALLAFARSRGWAVRALALAMMVLALANPSFTREDREPLSSVVAVVVDKSPSQNFGDRLKTNRDRTRAAGRAARPHPRPRRALCRSRRSRRRNRWHQVVLGAQRGARRRAARPRRRSHHADRRACARRPGRSRSAGLQRAGPCAHHRRPQRARSASRAGDDAALRHRRPVADRGLSRRGPGRAADAGRGHDPPRRRGAGAPQRHARQHHQRANPDPARRPNIVEIEASPLENELTAVNNRAVVSIDGVRDKLRVLLVSGEPHAGERTWRNF